MAGASPVRPPRRRITIADVMLLVAFTAGLFGVILGGPTAHLFDPIQGVITWAAGFLCLGGFGACAARMRGRPRFEGFCWGFICGPFGVLMIALMPGPPDKGPTDTDAFKVPWG